MYKYLVINEEYGYRYWVAKIDETQIDEIKTWWLKLETVLGMFFNPKGKLPVEITELTHHNEDQYEDLTMSNVLIYIELHEDDDSSLKIIGDQTYYHAGYETNK